MSFYHQSTKPSIPTAASSGRCKIIVNNKHFETISDKLQSIREKWNIKKQLIEYNQKIQLIKDMNNEVLFAYWKYNDDDDDL